MRWVLTLLAWLAAVAVIAPVTVLITVVLAGPHSSMLPSVIQPAVLLSGWLAVIVGPVIVARAVFARLRRRESQPQK